jgi:hypothetical protein
MIFITNKYNNLCRAYGASKSAMYWYQFDQMYHTDFQIRIHTEISPIILACYFPSALLLFYFLIFCKKKHYLSHVSHLSILFFFIFQYYFNFFRIEILTVCIMIIRLYVYKIKATFTLFKIMNSMGRIVNN